MLSHRIVLIRTFTASVLCHDVALKVWLFVPILAALAALYLLITPFTMEPMESALALIFIACGVPVYFLCVYTKVVENCCGNCIGEIILRFLFITQDSACALDA